MRAALLIPLYNGARFIRACLASLAAQHDPPPTMVVENGSADDGADLVAREFPAVQLLRSDRPLGFAGACNAGLRVLGITDPGSFIPEAVVIVNQDTELDPGCLAALLAPLEADPRVGVVGAVARFPDGRIQHAGGALTRPLGYGRNLCAGEPALPAELPAPDYMAFVVVALRTAMLREVGALDEGFSPAYYEDADLCLRATAAGWKLALARDATLVHHEGAAGDASYRHAALIERGRLRLALKHRAPGDLLGAFYEAERAQLLRRALAGTAQVLRQAYARALLDLPAIAAARGLLADDQAALADMLAALRHDSTAPERASRLFGLRPAPGPASPAAHAAPADPARPAIAPPPTPVAIIILTWNGLDYTRRCLDSLRAHTADTPYRLIVVDNGSSDGTLDWLRAQADVTLIANATNLGFVRGNNQGMRAAPPDHDVLLLNNDTVILHDGWLAGLRAAAHAHPANGIVGCTLLHADGRLQHAGTYMPTDSFWGYQIGGGEAYVGQYPGLREVEGITGACMYIRHDARAALGGLDEDYFSYFEDTDFCLRARQAGFRVVVTGAVQVGHYENTSTRLNNASWRAMWQKGQATFLAKWRGHFASKYTRALGWRASLHGAGPEAALARALLLELDARGVELHLALPGGQASEPLTRDPRLDQLRARPHGPALPEVTLGSPALFAAASGTPRIGFTLPDADALTPELAAQANRMDELWTDSAWSADVLRASGVTRPLHVVPPGVSGDYFHPGIRGRRPAAGYVFLAAGAWGPRDGLDLAVRAFLRAFRDADDVLLLLWASSPGGPDAVRRELAELARGGPRIVALLDQPVARSAAGCLYRSADCFVQPARGAGAQATLEAMACGLPVIATAWGARAELVHAGVGLPLRARGLAAAPGGGRWAEPDLEQLALLMRTAYERPDEARALGALAAAEAARRWTWACAADRVIERLDALA